MFFERDTPTFSEVLTTSFIFICLFYLVKTNLKKHSEKITTLTIVGCVIFCIFDYCDGDFFHYREHFKNINKGYESPFEEVYNHIISLSWSYYFFRLIVWGLAIWIIRLSVKILRINDSTFWYLFVIYSLLLFAYARVSLALAIAMCGFTIIISTKPKDFLLYCIGILLIIGSAYFHKSIIIILLLIPLSYIGFGKKSIIVAICLLPILIYFVNNYLITHLLNLDLGEDQQSAVRNYILNSDGLEDGGIARKFLDILEQLPTYICALYFIKLFNNNFASLSSIKRFAPIFRWTLLIIICSTSFILFPYTKVLYYRIMYLARVPAIVGLSIAYNRNQISKKHFRLFCFFAIISDVASLSYSLYLSIVK